MDLDYIYVKKMNKTSKEFQTLDIFNYFFSKKV